MNEIYFTSNKQVIAECDPTTRSLNVPQTMQFEHPLNAGSMERDDQFVVRYNMEDGKIVLSRLPILLSEALSSTKSINNSACNICGKHLGAGPRFALIHVVQNVDRSDSNSTGIMIHSNRDHAYYCCKEHALLGSREYLSQFGSELTVQDGIHLIEKCGICGGGLDTDNLHQAVMIVHERGCQLRGQVLDTDLLALFCPSCAPQLDTSAFFESFESVFNSMEILTE